jgi:hypothetical protein
MSPGSHPYAHDRRRAMLLSLISVLIGGLCGWASAFAGMNLWGLIVGAAVTVALIGALAARERPHGLLRTMLGYGFAFTLLTWPLLWLVVGYARYLITGQTLGS